MKIIINADDFGYSNGINYGIIDSHLEGVLSSTTLMVDMPGTEHAVKLMKAHPTLGVGLHLNLTFNKPLTDGTSLLGPDGIMMKPDAVVEGHHYDEDELMAEITAQYQRFVDLTGCKPSHLDSHLFATDKIDAISKAAIKFARKMNIPLRNKQINGYPFVEFITHHRFGVKAHLSYLETFKKEIFKYEMIEIMVHPGYVDAYLLANSSYVNERTEEVAMLTGQQLKALIDHYDGTIISYRDIGGTQ